MDFYWNTTAVVADTDLTGLSIDGYTDLAHLGVILFVICSVDQDLIEDLVQARHKGDFAILHTFFFRAIHPQLFLHSFDGADIGIRASQNMFERRQLPRRLEAKPKTDRIVATSLTFEYLSLAEALATSFSSVVSGSFTPPLLARPPAAALPFFALGGVLDICEPPSASGSTSSSSSEILFSASSGAGACFLGPGFALAFPLAAAAVVAAVFLGRAFALVVVAAAFLGAGFALGFYGRRQ